MRASGFVISAFVTIPVVVPISIHAQGMAATRDSLAIEKVKLADDIFLFRAPSALDIWTSSNTVVIVNDDDVTVFDSNARPSTSRLVIAEIRKLTNKPVRVLINSHWHMDHWMGNEAYAKAFPGLQIVSTLETRNYMRRLPVQVYVNSVGVDRARARLDSVVQSGKLADGAPLTTQRRAELEQDLRSRVTLSSELATTTQVFPTLAFGDSLTLWSGTREFRLFNVTGDATGSAALYLPKEKLLATGDVLVRSEEGDGAQPWTTNSDKITPWLGSLRRMEALDLAVIVPGQGPPLYDKQYLRRTVALFDAILGQVHQALEAGAFRVDQVLQAVKLDAVRQQFTKDDAALNARFDRVAATLIRKAYQEARDGLATP